MKACLIPPIHFYLYHFIYFWLRWVFVAVRGLSPLVASGGHFLGSMRRFLIAVASLVEHRVKGPRALVVAARGLSICGTLA